MMIFGARRESMSMNSRKSPHERLASDDVAVDCGAFDCSGDDGPLR